jgi:thiopurine S-methyltransferase
MQPSFWQERWVNGLIGFHQTEVNPALRALWPRFKLPAGSAVLVPLCGKTLDMLWLAERGHRVLGVELSELASRAFFEESALTYQERPIDGGILFEAERADLDLRIWCGDFFELTPERFGTFDACFDRASLIALPEALQERHASRLLNLLKAGASGLLLGLDYDQNERQGPPFSTPQKRVYDLLGEAFELTLLAEEDLSGGEFAERMGVDRAVEFSMSFERLGS